MVDQMLEFIIFRILLKGSDRYTIIQLRWKWVNCVVNDQDVFKGHIFENSQIFYVDVVGGLDAWFTVEPMLNELTSRIYII